MPTDTSFSLGGHALPCPEFKPGFVELGDIDYEYLNGSHLYVGMVAVTYTWPKLDETYVAIIRTLYDDLIASFDPFATTGSPVSGTVPDYANGGWRVTTFYLFEPTGTAKGTLSENFSVKLYNLHEGSLLAAMAAGPEFDLYTLAQTGANIEIGSSEYPDTDYQW